MSLNLKLNESLDSLDRWMRHLRKTPVRRGRPPSPNIDITEDDTYNDEIMEYKVGKKMSQQTRLKSDIAEIKDLKKDLMLSKMYELEAKKLEKENKALDEELKGQEESNPLVPDVNKLLDPKLAYFLNPETLEALKKIDQDTLYKLVMLTNPNPQMAILSLLRNNLNSPQGHSTQQDHTSIILAGMMNILAELIKTKNTPNNSSGEQWAFLTKMLELILKQQSEGKNSNQEVFTLLKELNMVYIDRLLSEINSIRANMNKDNFDQFLGKISQLKDALQALGLANQSLPPEIQLELKKMDNEIKRWAIDKEREIAEKKLEEEKDMRKQKLLMDIAEKTLGVGWQIFGETAKKTGEEMAEELKKKLQQQGAPPNEPATQ